MFMLHVTIFFVIRIVDHNVIGCEHYTVKGSSSYDSGNISSPQFPAAFPDGPYICTYTISHSAGGIVALQFHDFITQGQINHDYQCSEEIYIYEDSRKNAKHFCSQLPIIFTSTSSTVIVEFNVKQKNDYKVSGFKATFNFLNNTNIAHSKSNASSVHTLNEDYSPQYSYTKGGYIDFYKDPFGGIQRLAIRTNNIYIWVIRALEDHVVSFLVTDLVILGIEVHPADSVIVVRDGFTSEGNTIGMKKYRSNDEETYFYRIDSSTEGLHITMDTSSLQTRRFVAKYTSVKRKLETEICPEGYHSCLGNRCIGQTALCEDRRFCGEKGRKVDILCGNEDGGFCKNDGDCKNAGHCFGTGSYCFCRPGFGGDYCEYNLLDCVPSCMNGGVCNSGACECPKNYSGRRCEVAIIIITEYSWVGFFVGSLTYVVITVTVVAVITRKVIKYKRIQRQGNTASRSETGQELRPLTEVSATEIAEGAQHGPFVEGEV
ncbi:uncharacterized protein LOC100377626 [Saccoglossus kowalevskii]|uniref:Uncharacterized protein LOC100377626 n=1 Tax=Saccoglossus kowalevskii TaxID=10224 RepID=A0ABM0GRL8_SACKO|nr:PREDICTED: uncharacterized protein LOC100377626 [Saccoglossus kowalevskii]